MRDIFAAFSPHSDYHESDGVPILQRRSYLSLEVLLRESVSISSASKSITNSQSLLFEENSTAVTKGALSKTNSMKPVPASGSRHRHGPKVLDKKFALPQLVQDRYSQYSLAATRHHQRARIHRSSGHGAKGMWWLLNLQRRKSIQPWTKCMGKASSRITLRG
eukprot:TRINITY_DN5566_c0_g2_i1.p1 TRINITY_DN5566_c0_g2~~TRINITY_DN5566_c0_g2_i1.p1  ORF type:complete len:163 (+),score=7.06 TRINITY_DN5566_c0_g2_i1:30-518(+)